MVESSAADFAAWAHWHADPLSRIEDRGPPTARVDDSDLAPLAEMVGDARIVAIGETVHHTHEFLALRERLVRYLVERMGFDTIVLEAVRPGANPIDDYVSGGKGSAEMALLVTGARMWRNTETARIVEWAAAHRSASNAPLRVHGMDVLAPGDSMRAVIAALQPAAAAQLVRLSRGFDADGLADQKHYNGLAAEDRALLHAVFKQAAIACPGGAALANHALVACQALETLEIGTRGWTHSIARRDAAMAENVLRLLDAEPGRRLIILSHNMHVCAAKGPPVVLGSLLREKLASGYRAIGTAYGRARFDPPIYGVHEGPAAGSDTLDQRIRRDGAFLLDLRGGGGGPDFLQSAMHLQTIEPGIASSVRYDSISEAFDIVAFVPTLSNARQLIETELALDVAAIDATRS